MNAITHSMDSEHESEDDFQNDDARTEDGSERGDADEGKPPLDWILILLGL